MNARLVLTQPTLRGVRLLLLLVVMLGVPGAFVERLIDRQLHTVAWIVIVGAAVFVNAIVRVRARATEFELGLPLSGHAWLLVRFLGLAVAVSLPVVAFAVCLVVPALVAQDGVAVVRAIVRAANMWGAELFAVAVFHAAIAVEGGRPRVPVAIGLGCLGFAAALFGQVLDALGVAALLVAAAAGVLAWTLARAPACPPFEGERRAAAGWSWTRRTTGVHGWLLRRCALDPANLAVFGAGLLCAPFFIMQGGGIVWACLIYGGWTATSVARSLRVLGELGHLPIPRRALAAHVLLPPLACTALSLGLHALTGPLAPQWEAVELSPERVDPARDDRFFSQVSVPGALWQLHVGSAPVEVTAPDGESVRLTRHPLFWGVGIVNPYSVAPTSSCAFVDWQLRRAVEVAYGDRFERGTLAAPPDWDPQRCSTTLGGAEYLREPHDRAPAWSRANACVTMLQGAALAFGWFLGAWWALRGVPRSPAHAARQRWHVRVAFAVLLPVLFAHFAGMLFAYETEKKWLQAVGATLARSVPAGASWATLGAWVVLLAAALQWRFRRIEVPTGNGAHATSALARLFSSMAGSPLSK